MEWIGLSAVSWGPFGGGLSATSPHSLMSYSKHTELLKVLILGWVEKCMDMKICYKRCIRTLSHLKPQGQNILH